MSGPSYPFRPHEATAFPPIGSDLGHQLAAAQEQIHELKLVKDSARQALIEASTDGNPYEEYVNELIYYTAKVGLRTARLIRNDIRNEMGVNRRGIPAGTVYLDWQLLPRSQRVFRWWMQK